MARQSCIASHAGEAGAPVNSPGRLVVEIYRPPPRAGASARPAPLRLRSGGFARLIAAVAVVIAHAAVGAWLWLDTAGGLFDHVSRGPLTLMPVESPPPPRITYDGQSSIASSIELPTLDAVPHAVPRIHIDVVAPMEVALTASSTADTLIGDANVADAARLLAGCGGRHAWRLAATSEAALVILLVRVEPDGHVSDTKIEVGSGAPSIDTAAQRCISASSILPPRRLNGEATLSWQRVRFTRD